MHNYLIKAVYWNDAANENHSVNGIITAESYEEALQLFRIELNCHIQTLTISELQDSERIVYLSNDEYDSWFNSNVDSDVDVDEGDYGTETNE